MLFIFGVERFLFQTKRLAVTCICGLEGADEQSMDYTNITAFPLSSPSPKLQPACGTATQRGGTRLNCLLFCEIFLKRAMILHMQQKKKTPRLNAHKEIAVSPSPSPPLFLFLPPFYCIAVLKSSRSRNQRLGAELREEHCASFTAKPQLLPGGHL